MNDYLLRMRLLGYLRDHYKVAAISRKPDPLDLNAIRGETGLTLEDIKGTLSQLILLDHVRPQPGHPDHLALEGYCRITPKGMEALDEFEAKFFSPVEKRKPVGF